MTTTLQTTQKQPQNQELPHPSEEPEIRWCHEGKEYKVAGIESNIRVVKYLPNELSGTGLVVVEFTDREDTPLHETERDESGVEKEALQPYIEKYGDMGAVMSAPRLVKDMQDFKIQEVDFESYHEIYYEETGEW